MHHYSWYLGYSYPQGTISISWTMWTATTTTTPMRHDSISLLVCYDFKSARRFFKTRWESARKIPTTPMEYSNVAKISALLVPPHHEVPSGDVKIAIENDHRNSGFSHKTWWFSIARGHLNSQMIPFPLMVIYIHTSRDMLVNHHVRVDLHHWCWFNILNHFCSSLILSQEAFALWPMVCSMHWSRQKPSFQL